MYIYIALILIAFTGGWEARGWKDTASITNTVIHQNVKISEGENKIVANEQKIRRVYVKTKDDCINKPMPDNVRMLLLPK